MREYQRTYLANLREFVRLNQTGGELPGDAAAFLAEHRDRAAAARRIVRENTALLRDDLFPVLDDIVSAGAEEVAGLEEFAERLSEGGANRPDLLLSYSIHNALITYARRWGKRDMLIRALYQTGMDLFYMEGLIARTGRSRYRWKMGLMFGEAAAYIREYDRIDDPEIRGYIHRAMGNLALSYSGVNEEDGRRKLAAIRRSLQILEDPVYREKTPSLPWELYTYKSHQERATALGLLRAGISDPQVLREVMESAQYIHERQLEAAQKQGTRPLVRWQMVYEAAQYHCGIRPLPELLRWLEQVYLERDEGDYSENGVYSNVFIPALYADYLRRNEEYLVKKKPVLSHMYRRLVHYARSMPANQLDEVLQQDLISCVLSFVEYPDGISRRDFLLQLVVCRNPDAYVVLRMVAQVTRLMAARALREQPEQLVGVLGCESVEQLRAREEEVLSFAFDSGMLHDVGLLVFDSMTRRIGRSWMQEEREMYQYHVYAGEQMLRESESTRLYAPTALGHHRYFDGGDGYPADYVRKTNPNRAITDLVGGAALLIHLTDDLTGRSRENLTLDQALERVRAQAGTNLSPFAAGLLLEMRGELAEYLKDGQLRAYEEAFRLLRGVAGGQASGDR